MVLRHSAALVSGLAIVLATAGIPALSGQAARATIRGYVELEPRTDGIARRPDPAGPRDPLPRDREDYPRAVVYFEAAPAGAFEDRTSARATLDQRDERFVPQVVAITVGTTVDFPNNDRTYHNVFSLSKTRRFDLGRYAAGRSKSVRFDRPGIVRVFCDIHSHMNAFILVFAHRYFDVTNADGRYRIDGVPPGSYTLSAWVDGNVRDQRSVTITPDVRHVEVDFPAR